MKTDTLTKSLLAAVAVFLGMIAFNGFDAGPSPAAAQQPLGNPPAFAHLQIAAAPDRFYVLETATGRLWLYSAADFTVDAKSLGRINTPGQRLQP